MAKPKQKLYLITHAYYHYVAELVEITGKREGVFKNIRQIHSDARGWTNFFKRGFGTQTQFDEMPDGGELSWINCFPWNHEIPNK